MPPVAPEPPQLVAALVEGQQSVMGQDGEDGNGVACILVRWRCVAFTSARRFTTKKNDITNVEIHTEWIEDKQAVERAAAACWG